MISKNAFHESLPGELVRVALLSWDLFPAQFCHDMETKADELEIRGKALSRLKQHPYEVTEGFVFITSVTALSSPVCRGTTKNAAVRSERGGELWVDAK